MNRSETISKLVEAKVQAQKAFPRITKSERASFKSKKGFDISYSYSTLPNLLDQTRPALSDNGLGLFHLIDEDEKGTYLEVILAHTSGEFISSRKNLGTFSDPQAFGSALTYYRRYLSEALLGVASQDDDDGTQASRASQDDDNGMPVEVSPKVKYFNDMKNDYGYTPAVVAGILRDNGHDTYDVENDTVLRNIIQGYVVANPIDFS